MATTTHTERALSRPATPSRKTALRIATRVSTGLFAAMFAFSGVLFLSGAPVVVTAFQHLGYPDYFRKLLGASKLLGVVALIVPLPIPFLREWAYAGFAFVCLAASASHLASGDPFDKVVGPLFSLALLLTSYFLRRASARADQEGA